MKLYYNIYYNIKYLILNYYTSIHSSYFWGNGNVEKRFSGTSGMGTLGTFENGELLNNSYNSLIIMCFCPINKNGSNFYYCFFCCIESFFYGKKIADGIINHRCSSTIDYYGVKKLSFASALVSPRASPPLRPTMASTPATTSQDSA